MRKPAGRSQRGYTLIEALVAVAIIGMISLVAVPNFMTYYRAGRIKASLRQFTSEVRNARQVAVSQQGCSMVSFTTGITATTYDVYIGDYSAGACSNWTLDDSGELQQSVYFLSSEFTDDVDVPASSGTRDIIFKPNGTTVTTPIEARWVKMRTSFDVPFNEFEIDIFPSGQLKITP